MLRSPLIFALACSAFAQTGELLVLHKGASSLGWYTAAGELLHAEPVGQHPHEMVMSPDRRFLYVTDNGTMRLEHAGTGGNTISVIDLAQKKRVAQISLGNFRRPHGISLDPATGRLAVSTELPDRMLIIDAKSRKVIRDYDTKGKTSHMVVFGPKAQWAYVSNSGSAAVAAIRLADGEVKLIETSTRPEGSAMAHNGKELYVVNREAAKISVIDTASNTLAGTVETGKGPVRVAVTPDGNQLVYALMHDKQVGFANVASRKQLGTVSLPGTPVSLTLSRDGKLAYASAEESDEFYVISVPDRKLLRTIKTAKGTSPDPVFEAPVMRVR